MSVAGFSVNVAPTTCAVAGIVNVQVALVLLGQIVLHPPNPEPEFGTSVSETCVPGVTFVVHPAVEPLTQLIPAPDTVPEPVPPVDTDSCTVVVPGLNVAVTVNGVAGIANAQVVAVLPLQGALHPANVEPFACVGVSVNVTCVPAVRLTVQQRPSIRSSK